MDVNYNIEQQSKVELLIMLTGFMSKNMNAELCKQKLPAILYNSIFDDPNIQDSEKSQIMDTLD